MLVDVTHLKSGEVGVVKEIAGGFSLAMRMQNMGVRVGERVKKISSERLVLK